VGIRQRIEKLEAGTIGTSDIDHALVVFRAWCLVRDDPARATDKDRLLAAEDWQEALCILIDAAGGPVIAASHSLCRTQRNGRSVVMTASSIGPPQICDRLENLYALMVL
jgi:hypothetical protein